MAKDPAFLFYPNDWLGGTIGMSFEEKGAYMELLIAQFNLGHMTSHMENENENINTIVSYLNITAKKNFSAKTKMTARIISARLKQGRTIDEFKKVIDTKTKQWINNPDMNKYLSPDTLFAEKNMEKYLMEETNPSNSSVGQTALSEKNIAKLI